jgi:hypothetical protein
LNRGTVRAAATFDRREFSRLLRAARGVASLLRLAATIAA